MSTSLSEARRETRAPRTPRGQLPIASPHRSGLVAAGVVAVVVLAMLGAVLGIALLSRGVEGNGADVSVLRTRTGTLEVGALTVGAAHDPKDMIGMPPGQAHEAADGVTVLVPVTLTNTSDAPVEYAPAQFSLLADGVEAQPSDASGDDAPRSLRPNAAITLRLSFIAPPAEDPQLRYTTDDGEQVLADLDPIVAHQAPDTPEDQNPTQDSNTSDHGHGDDDEH